MNEQLRQAISAWSAVLGDEYVKTQDRLIDQYARSTSPWSTRPAAILFPVSTEQVQQIVKIASEHLVPLYPISRGRNWGYGDACAPTDGQVIVDLARMNRILEHDSQLGYVVIEAGVTQKQLHDYLRQHKTGLWMDSTGAGLEASLVGNTLDRGFGHTRCGDHYLNTCGMQVVLPDGSVLETGFGHYGGAKAHRVYRYGVGPMLDGLFCQSNFGIVTRIGLWVMPRPEAFTAFFFAAPNDADLADLVDRLQPLRLQGLLQSTIHIGNDLRVLSSRIRYPWGLTAGKTPLPDDVRQKLRRHHRIGAWNGLGGIYGTRATVKATQEAVRKALRGYRLRFIGDSTIAVAQTAAWLLRHLGLGRRLTDLLDLLKPPYDLLKGIPSDDALTGAGWRLRDPGKPQPLDPRDTHAGLIWVSPVLPSRGALARELMDLVTPIYLKHGFDPLVTFTMITERAMIGVTNIAFDKTLPEEVAHAQACYEELVTTLIPAGYIPYRTGPQGYAKLSAQPSVFWDVTRQIKRLLDPKGIISPGRYINT